MFIMFHCHIFSGMIDYEIFFCKMGELKPFFTFLDGVKYSCELATHQDWTRADGLPEGWMKRVSEASNHIIFLSPQGRVFHNKASVTMFLSGGPVDEDLLKQKPGPISHGCPYTSKRMV